MTEKEYLYLLLHAAGTGVVTAQRLYEHFGSYERIWKAEKRELELSGLLAMEDFPDFWQPGCGKRRS